MRTYWSENRSVWLGSGALLGLVASFYWPHEQARAETVDRSDKIAMLTVNTQAGESDAVFLLDFVTGRLIGRGLQHSDRQFQSNLLRRSGCRLSGRTRCRVHDRIRPGVAAADRWTAARKRRYLRGGIEFGQGDHVRVSVCQRPWQPAPMRTGARRRVFVSGIANWLDTQRRKKEHTEFATLPPNVS